jgi:hypothetical protein
LDSPVGTAAVEVRPPEFLGPQTGSIALDLQGRFAAALCHFPAVRRAYFCWLLYPGENVKRAAVCVACDGDERTVLAALSAALRPVLADGTCVDILFLTPALEGQLAAVCPPFYAPDRLPDA